MYISRTAGWGGGELLHHIAGEHEWIDRECDHGPLVAAEIGKTYLDKNSKAFEAIRKVVLDQKFLKSSTIMLHLGILSVNDCSYDKY